MIGKVLKGRYKITENIGYGGMAEVYKAIDMSLDRVVAVKVLRPQFAADDGFVKKFGREARAAGSLSDGNIVGIFDIGAEDGLHYIVMEFVEGETLQKLITREAPLAWERAVFIARGIAGALCKAHARGIVHCDIKPHNIMIDAAGNPKVSDFGIAHAISSSTITFAGSILGSVHYLSPEQAKGEPVTFSSDIYSLGVALFEMLTGQLPFTGDTPIAVAMKHVQSSPPVLRDVNAGAPAVLEAVVSRALAKKPEERYESAEMFIKALDAARECAEGEGGLFSEGATTVIDKAAVQDALEKSKPAAVKVRRLTLAKYYKYLAPVFSLAAVFFLSAYVMYAYFGGAGEVEVPDLAGKQVEEAKTLLNRKNLGSLINEEFSAAVPAGLVISQTPAAGSIVKEYREIKVAVSKGPQLINVPVLLGANIQQALSVLENLSLSPGRVEEREEAGQEPGTVLWQNPSPPAQVGLGTYIDLVVAAAKGRKVLMPDLSGMTTNEARLRLIALKLKINDIDDQYTSDSPSGTVVGQIPLPGQQISEGDGVIIRVARSLNEQSKQGIVEFVVPDGKNQKIKIIVTDNRSRRAIYEGVHNSGERIRQTVDGLGNVRVQLYSNERLVEEKFI
ncbi:MAG: Stk1 family PASTA domain-containing Ser/Thr kinase [Acidaminococcales bacterium]|jgi:serine/threonine-protein kinase|nr:Stk1 family PASTA domain-containing Ser/Thr kinase [Acidaminococcales bacterium]